MRARIARRAALGACLAITAMGTGMGTGMGTARAGHAADGGTRIGIIGAGHVGTTLGRLWARAGDRVMLSARTLDEARRAAAAVGEGATAGTPAQAVAFGDVVVLAIPYGAIPETGAHLAAAASGKTVLDATNPYAFRDGAIAAVAARDGAGITTQRYWPGTHVVRAFNAIDMSSIAAQAHRAPPLLGIAVAGDDDQAVDQVMRLVRDAGFEPVRAGGLRDAIVFQPGHPGFGLQDDAPTLRRDLRQSAGSGE